MVKYAHQKCIGLLLLFLSFVNAHAQTQNPVVSKIRTRVQHINEFKNYKTIVLNGEDFLENTPDNGATLTGYFSQGKLVKMVCWIGLSNQILTKDFYLDDGHLIFLYTKRKWNVQGTKNASQKPTVRGTVVEARYYFDKEKLQAQKFSGDSSYRELNMQDLLDEADRYKKLLTQKFSRSN